MTPMGGQPAPNVSARRRAPSRAIAAANTGTLFFLCGFVIIASLILGGGTRGGFLSDAILQLIAIPLLLISLWRLIEIPLTGQMRLALFFCIAIVAIPLVQLIPLPPWLWTALPGRDAAAATFEILGQNAPWMPISVVPYETWLSMLSLIPPLAIFLATMMLPYRERRWLSFVFLAVGVLSVFIGMVQVAQGQESPWRFFEFTNATEAVGFFANRNHFAAFLYCLTLFAAVWALQATVVEFAQGERKLDTVFIVGMIAAFTLLVVLLAGQVMARSRMGLGLTIVALFGGLALGASDRRIGSAVGPGKLLAGAVILVVIFSVQFALYRVMERFVVDPLEGARGAFSRNTIEAAIAYMPFGSGLGTFVPVYAMFEKPQDTILGIYANHAHNDVAELWLNTGAFGLALFGMFVVWLALRSVEIWQKRPAEGASQLDWNLARAATIVVAVLIVHSFVDYPLRTGAMMAVLAFACGLLVEPPVSAQPQTALESLGARARTRLAEIGKLLPPALATKLNPVSVSIPKAHAPDLRRIAPPGPDERPTPTPSEAKPLSSDRRWGAEVDWPEEWSKPPAPASANNNPQGGSGEGT